MGTGRVAIGRAVIVIWNNSLFEELHVWLTIVPFNSEEDIVVFLTSSEKLAFIFSFWIINPEVDANFALYWGSPTKCSKYA